MNREWAIANKERIKRRAEKLGVEHPTPLFNVHLRALMPYASDPHNLQMCSDVINAEADWYLELHQLTGAHA